MYGTFGTYIQPGVFSKTLSDSGLAALVSGLRIPTILGVGAEELDAFDVELVRGSSSFVDQQILAEDVTLSWIVDDTNPNLPILGENDGLQLRFRVRNFPLVDGQGFGRTTNDANSVSVTVNGQPVAVGQVRGAKGEVILQTPPAAGSVVRCTYFFHRGDTLFTDDVSYQVSDAAAELTSPGFAPFSVVAGVSDTLKLKINGGAESTVLFTASPAVQAVVTIPGTGANAGVTYKAVDAGTAGNSIRVRHVVAGNSTPLSISVAGLDITVNVATDGGGAPTSTATLIAAAILASGPASALVTATVTGNGSGITLAAAYTNLVGGLDGGSVSALKSQIDAQALTGLTTAVYTDNAGRTHLLLTASVSLEITSGNANGILGFSAGLKTTRNASFFVANRPVVDGSSSGLTTTDTSKVVVKVNGIQVIPTSLDGKNGKVTLAAPPAPGSTVTVNYYANTWQDTFDYLPNTLVTNVVRAGISSGRSDYIQGADFVVSNPSPDVSIIHWGASTQVASTRQSPAATSFGENQVLPTLVDDKLYLAECASFVDTSVVPALTSKTEFLLPAVPTLGNGRDTPLTLAQFKDASNGKQGVVTNRPDLIEVRAGRNLSDALGRPSIKVLLVDASTRKITLKDALPPDYKVYASFWTSRLVDDAYILTNKTPGPVGSGQFEVLSTLTNTNLHQIKFKVKSTSLVDTVQWPRGVETIPDAHHFGGTPVSETARVTFSQSTATKAEYTVKGAQPWSIYTPTSATWRSNLNNAGALATNLATATRAYLVGKAKTLTGGNLAIAVGSTLELTIDGVSVSVALPSGSQAPSAIVTAINTAIDAKAEFGGGSTNNYLCSAILTSGSEVYFVIRGFSTPASLPGGFDHVSKVQIRQGTGETLLGFVAFQEASGTTGAVNKAATLLGTKVEAFSWTAGVNDVFKVRVNGIDYSITIQAASTSASAVVADINAVIPATQGAASVGSLANLNKIRLTSALNSEQSAIVILNGSANSVLGFNQGDFASQTKVSVQEVVNRLMDTTNFAVTSWGAPGSPGTAPTTNASGAVALAEVVDGSTYLKIDSLTTGTSSSVAFADGANSAFNGTGVNVKPGIDGDSGSAASDIFTVTSTNPLGSAGTGVPGQTYTDARTGLRFSVLPAVDGSYPATSWFELEVSTTFDVNPSIPSYAVPGLELIVSNTVGVGEEDTATLTTFGSGGVEPKNGDFYFVSYRYLKQDYTPRVFRQFKQIEANYGRLSAENRVTLGAYLSILNGAVLIGINQVKRVPNTNQGSAQSFIDEIAKLAAPFPGNIKPDVLVPLSTDPAVFSFLTQHCEIMSNIRNQSERMGMVGFASGTSPTSAQSIARGLASARIVALYPDSAVITLSNELGANFEILTDGSFFAAAMAGAACSPAVDVATPYTRRRIQGFTRIPRIMDAVEANQTATAGITVFEDLDPIVRIRQGLTTDMSTLLTKLPTVTQIADYTSQQSRGVLDAFIGTKFLSSRASEIEVALTSLFKSLVQQEVVGAFNNISAQSDSEDPTVLTAEAFYQPIFPLLYIILTFNLRARLLVKKR